MSENKFIIRREGGSGLQKDRGADARILLERIPSGLYGALCSALLPERSRICAGIGSCHGAGRGDDRSGHLRALGDPV